MQFLDNKLPDSSISFTLKTWNRYELIFARNQLQRVSKLPTLSRIKNFNLRRKAKIQRWSRRSKYKVYVRYSEFM